MRIIDADVLKDRVLKWLPPDPCGVQEKEFPFEEDICVSMLMEIDDAPTYDVGWRFILDDLPDVNAWYMTIVWDALTGIHASPAFYIADTKVWDRANVILWYPHSEPTHEEIMAWWDGSDLEKRLRKKLGYGF